MVVAGVLTRVIPAGVYDRTVDQGRTLVVPGSYRQAERPVYPAWRWFTAPIEVLWSGDSLTVITIILFLVFIGGAFAVVEKWQVLAHILATFVARFRARKYFLMAGVMFFFALCGGVLGIYEEAVPLVVFVVTLAHALGWDTLVGLPLFSGAGLRAVFFLVTYGIVFLFVYRYARKVERDPTRSLCYAEDAALREAHVGGRGMEGVDAARTPRMMRASAWLSAWILLTLVFILVAVVTRNAPPALSTYAFPVVGVFFLIAGLGAGFLAGMGARGTFGAFWAGFLNILPAVLLILMALSAKLIIVKGGIMDTILLAASNAITGAPKYLAAFLVYAATLVLEFFVGSASAKAFLMMPILAPLADLVGITRQATVLAYDIGDGFANMFFPTNALLLIALGLTVVGYPKWIRWMLPLQGIMFVVSMAFLMFAVAIGFAPF